MQVLARIPLSAGDFVVQCGEQGTFGVLATMTPIGLIRTRCDLPDARAVFGTGRALTELEIAPYDFAAAALNDVMQDAVGAATRYIQTLGKFQAPEINDALGVIMRAALHDDSCRQAMTDLVNLSGAHTNEEFNFLQAHIDAEPGTLGARLATMTPQQVQQVADHFRRAYDLVQDALPWLSDGLRTLLGQLQRGEITSSRTPRRFRDRYVDGPAATHGTGGTASATTPVENYTTGGAPINVGKYRACVGCTCTDPCADGSCESCCECSKS